MSADVARLGEDVLGFVERCRLPEAGPGRYRYALSCDEPTLYSSCYAAMTRSLLRDLDVDDPPSDCRAGACTPPSDLPGDRPDGAVQARALQSETAASERGEWAAYLNAHQDDDGLFRDPVIFGQGWYADDPLWCGRSHLTCHVITALACLGAVAAKEIAWLDPWRDCDALISWLANRDWGERVGWSGNEIMNVGTLLQYARDFHGDEQAGRCVECLLDWLERNHLNPQSGVWGSLEISDPVQRSHAVQAGYHWWPLFAYDGRQFPCVDRAVDTVLATQNPRGGFGWGVHNPQEPFDSSACEDIDSIDPLARMLSQTPHRREAIEAALRRGAGWVLTNRTPDGGFVFMLNRPFEYGHPQLRGEAQQGAMFPTWFRLLSLALVGQALAESPLRPISWQFVQCPGMQFSGARS